MMSDASPAEEDRKIPQDSAALARKRRIEMRNNKQRSVSEDEAPDSDSGAERKRPRVEEEFPPMLVDHVTSKPKPSIMGIKKHSRYDPGVPMNRDELKVWRKEARRVRNRESAAASRMRNRERIDELEIEVDAIKSRYAAALQRIVDLEDGVNDSFTPQHLRQDIAAMITPSSLIVRPATPEPQPQPVTTVSPPMSPAPSFCLGDEYTHTQEVNQKHQHIMDMISRPIACV
jgi:hypothetical protein